MKAKPKLYPLRAGLLAYNVAHAQSGLYLAAAALAKSTGVGSIPEMLRAMASAGPRAAADLLRGEPIGDAARDEIAFLRLLLLAIAEGRDVRAELLINRAKAGHRRKSMLGAMLAAEVDRRIADGKSRKPPTTKAQACAAMADATGLTEDAIAQAHTRERKADAATAKRAHEAERAHAATTRKPRPKSGQ